jgi:hypothetical protein
MSNLAAAAARTAVLNKSRGTHRAKIHRLLQAKVLAASLRNVNLQALPLRGSFPTQ